MQTTETVAALLADMRALDAHAREDTADKWLRPRSLHPDSAQFLNLLAQAANAQAILEIGTSVGFSTVHLALAAQETGGHVTTLELLPAKFEAAQINLARGGLSFYVTQHLGDALALLPTLPGPWDLVFLDPEKELYIDAWNLFKDHVRPGGLVVADNLLSHAEDLQGYREAIAADGRYDTLTVPIGLGLELSYPTALIAAPIRQAVLVKADVDAGLGRLRQFAQPQSRICNKRKSRSSTWVILEAATFPGVFCSSSCQYSFTSSIIDSSNSLAFSKPLLTETA